MPNPLHVNEIHIRATPDEVWTAITDPDWTRRYLEGVAIETSLAPGSAVRYLRPDQSALSDGVVEIVEPGRRLVMTWTSLHDATTRAEPPSRIEWTLEPATSDGSVTRVRVRHYDLGRSPATWALAGPGWRLTLDALKTILETGQPLGPIDMLDPPAPAQADDIDRSWHRSLAVDANNSTWELLDGRVLDDETAIDLLGRAYAAAHHWREVAGPQAIQAARAAWLCSRAHATLGHGPAAAQLARLCARLTESSPDAVDFDRVYAIEAEARALACLGQLDDAAVTRRRAVEQAAVVADPEDRAIVEGDLAAEPWFGLEPLPASDPRP